jgi:hypothetical protein
MRRAEQQGARAVAHRRCAACEGWGCPRRLPDRHAACLAELAVWPRALELQDFVLSSAWTGDGDAMVLVWKGVAPWNRFSWLKTANAKRFRPRGSYRSYSSYSSYRSCVDGTLCKRVATTACAHRLESFGIVWNYLESSNSSVNRLLLNPIGIPIPIEFTLHFKP